MGDAKYHLNPAEYASLGSPAFTNVPVAFIQSVTGVAPAGSRFLRDPATGAIWQVVGGARYHLSAAEYAELRSPAFLNVPAGFVATLGEMPRDRTYLRDPSDGAIYEILSGTKRHLTAEEWAALGEVDYTNVPQGFLDTIPTA